MDNFTTLIIIITIAFISLLALFGFFYIAYNKKVFNDVPDECFCYIDISNRRKLDANSLIDEYICEHNNLTHFSQKEAIFKKWYSCTTNNTKNALLFKMHKFKQLAQYLKDNNFTKGVFNYNFIFYKSITKYKQLNYVKTSYKEEIIQETVVLSKEELLSKFRSLSNINFETTIKKYNSKKQRNLMTTELRKSVLEKYNYTCCKCGNSIYKEPNLLLEVDHIVPVAKGGKTTLSNLQVLCWKCNRTKGDKI